MSEQKKIHKNPRNRPRHNSKFLKPNSQGSFVDDFNEIDICYGAANNVLTLEKYLKMKANT